MLTKENLYMKAIEIIGSFKEVAITLSNGVDDWTFTFDDGYINKIDKKLPPSWPAWITESLFLVVNTWLDKELFKPGFIFEDPLKTITDFHINKLLWLEDGTKKAFFFEEYKDWIPKKTSLN